MPGQPGIDLAILQAPKTATAMSAPRLCPNFDISKEVDRPLVTGFEDADSPAAISAADFEPNMVPVPDPLNDAPIAELERSNSVSQERAMPSFIECTLHANDNMYLGPVTSARASNCGSSAGLPSASKPVVTHPHIVSPIPHPISSGLYPFPQIFPSGGQQAMFHTVPPATQSPESPQESMSSHLSAPPLPNMMATVLHPMEVHQPAPFGQPFRAPTPIQVRSENVYHFEFGMPAVVHAPGQAPRRIDGGISEHYTYDQESSLRGMTKPFEPETLPTRKHEGVKKTRRVRGQKARPPNPSRFCHICLRRGERVRLKTCSNLANKSCRKVTCEKCFEEFKWDWAAACAPDSNWTCTHCRGNCPDRAQCFIYKRTNNRRHQALMEKKARMGDGIVVAQVHEGMQDGGNSSPPNASHNAPTEVNHYQVMLPAPYGEAGPAHNGLVLRGGPAVGHGRMRSDLGSATP